jgi:hypothetical protein
LFLSSASRQPRIEERSVIWKKTVQKACINLKETDSKQTFGGVKNDTS